MENIKALYTANGRAYRVLAQPGWQNDEGIDTGVRIDWDWYGNPTGVTKYRIFDLFIGDIGLTNAAWDATADKDKTFYVLKKFLKETPDGETSPFVRDAATQLLRRTQQLQDQFAEEGYTLVRVEHSIDMQEGTITLKYAKEEK